MWQQKPTDLLPCLFLCCLIALIFPWLFISKLLNVRMCCIFYLSSNWFPFLADVFGINELTVYEGEWSEDTYCVSGDILDGVSDWYIKYFLKLLLLLIKGIQNFFSSHSGMHVWLVTSSPCFKTWFFFFFLLVSEKMTKKKWASTWQFAVQFLLSRAYEDVGKWGMVSLH